MATFSGQPLDGVVLVLCQILNAECEMGGGQVRFELHGQGGEAIIRVSDNGRGIEPQMLPRIFELFVQGDQTLARSEGGLGIGLTLLRSLVELHNGRVEAHSGGLGQGS